MTDEVNKLIGKKPPVDPELLHTLDFKEIELRILCAMLSNPDIKYIDMTDDFTMTNIIEVAKTIAKKINE